MPTLISQLIKVIDNSVEENGNPKISYVIGDNGSGKSRLLADICEHYEDNTQSSLQATLCITNAVSDRFRFTEGRLRQYLGLRNSGNAIFFSALSRQMAILVVEAVAQGRYKYLVELERTLGKRFDIDLGNTDDLNAENLSSTIDKRRIKPNQFNERFNLTKRRKLAGLLKGGLNFRQLSSSDAELLILYLQTRPSVTLNLRDKSGLHQFEALSSGERNLIALGLKIISHACPYALILIDEPEISLHMQWQMEFHKNLLQMLRPYKNYHVVIATHSPVLVSEAAKNSRTDAIFVLKSAPNKKNREAVTQDFKIIDAESVRSCDDLTLLHFHTPTYNSKAIDIRIAELVLDATSPASDGSSVEDLEKLRDTENLQPDKKATIEQAIDLIQERRARITNEKTS
ncbi:AAA family ATPase [Pseudomonas aeruginosa]|uniref:AAA family ATPase n=1 Tax=Pseudomonas aeruginosa TaxID=287 RepID=UPI001A1A1955|nr:AAA family ATPase [Pseudomonas aeruginosa]HBN9565025.1 AAA family ATPase [Pseudomonas aeruginosa]HBO3132155.1 AAA family ATPase [Pseudomonas aeruginosa]HEH9254308.1 AAA family ATPase [Pseudomonas aeruginosa]HEN8595425.1 AAA family ATPase [Pseudomonas aeruginosa]